MAVVEGQTVVDGGTDGSVVCAGRGVRGGVTGTVVDAVTGAVVETTSGMVVVEGTDGAEASTSEDRMPDAA